MQADAALEKQKSDAEDRRIQVQAKFDNQQLEMTSKIEQQKLQIQDRFERGKAQLDSETKIAVAQIQAKAQLQNTELAKDDGAVALDGDGNAVTQPNMADLIATVTQRLEQTLGGVQQSNDNVLQSHQRLAQIMSTPKRILRDPNTNDIVGLQ